MKALSVLRSLEAGIPVHIGDYIYCMTEEYDIVIQTYTYEDGELVKSDIYLNTDLTVGQFIRMCEASISDGEAFLIGANMVLNTKDFKNRKY